MKRNRRLLLKTARRIETIPQSYNQAEFRLQTEDSPCGTQACLAGEIIIASERSVRKGIELLFKPRRKITVGTIAAKLAGFTTKEKEDLFHTSFGSSWPEPFASRFERARGPKSQAKVAAALLRYLAEGGEV